MILADGLAITSQVNPVQLIAALLAVLIAGHTILRGSSHLYWKTVGGHRTHAQNLSRWPAVQPTNT